MKAELCFYSPAANEIHLLKLSLKNTTLWGTPHWWISGPGQLRLFVQAGWDRQRKVPRMMVAKRVSADRSLVEEFSIQLLFNSDLHQLRRMAEPQTGTGTYIFTSLCVDLEWANRTWHCRNVQWANGKQQLPNMLGNSRSVRLNWTASSDTDRVAPPTNTHGLIRLGYRCSWETKSNERKRAPRPESMDSYYA